MTARRSFLDNGVSIESGDRARNGHASIMKLRAFDVPSIAFRRETATSTVAIRPAASESSENPHQVRERFSTAHCPTYHDGLCCRFTTFKTNARGRVNASKTIIVNCIYFSNFRGLAVHGLRTLETRETDVVECCVTSTPPPPPQKTFRRFRKLSDGRFGKKNSMCQQYALHSTVNDVNVLRENIAPPSARIFTAANCRRRLTCVRLLIKS